ncbi:type IV toxin-antitoxin system AbiEi family antitoxin domain-containing protein [Streptomyces sp. NPDC060065]|uniref:type IV toxin-antitoxin system AbiEi family antitoxin domain-containing protein n=1 Tax=Streptomyces sp. NPDC060065 TaxID=3347050 RepID=UPI0036BD7861
MSAAENSRLEQRLTGLSPTFTTAQARQVLLSPRDLASLVAEGEIDELSRGVYRRADAPATAHADLLTVCARAPRAVVCGESALALHELIDDIPAVVHIAVPRGTRRPTISYPPTVVAQYVSKTFTLGVERFEAAPGETVPVYNAAPSVVDAMRHRNRIGETPRTVRTRPLPAPKRTQ